MIPNQKSYYGVTVSLAAAFTPYSLLALLRAVDPTVPGTCRELQIQTDPDNAAGEVLIGDANVTFPAAPPLRCAYKLDAQGETRPYRAGGISIVPLADIHIVGNVAALNINVEVMN